MITLFVNGKPIGNWADAERLFQEAAGTQTVEFRDSSGRVIAQTAPAAEPEWTSRITPEETQRRLAGEFLTFEEMKKRLGWE